jgi:hypothetical protein
MRTALPLGLFAILLFTTIKSTAQNDQFAYAITDVTKEGSAWKVLRKIDLKTGEYSSVMLDGTDAKTRVIDAATKKQIDLTNLTQENRDHLPFNSGVAAIALDRKHNRLYYTPMMFNQLRYIDLNSMKVFYVTDQPFQDDNKKRNDAGKIISRMVITPDGNGYAISNDASTFIQFNTNKKTSLKYLGALIDDPANKNISVHNSCSSYGGDIVADDNGALYLFSGPNNVFKINPETRVTTYLGHISGLPKDFTTNAAVVTPEGQMLISSAAGKVTNFLLTLKTLKAVPFQTNGLAYHTSDLANSNYIITKKSAFTTIETIKPLKSRLSNSIQIYPNPVVEDNKFTIQFNDLAIGTYTLELVGMSGQPVLRKNIAIGSKTNIQTITFPNTNAKGLYLVRLVTANKKAVFEQKLMVQ